jgi:hypothetical protein
MLSASASRRCRARPPQKTTFAHSVHWSKKIALRMMLPTTPTTIAEIAAMCQSMVPGLTCAPVANSEVVGEVDEDAVGVGVLVGWEVALGAMSDVVVCGGPIDVVVWVTMERLVGTFAAARWWTGSGSVFVVGSWCSESAGGRSTAPPPAGAPPPPPRRSSNPRALGRPRVDQRGVLVIWQFCAPALATDKSRTKIKSRLGVVDMVGIV